MSDSIERYCEQREKENKNFSRLSFFRQHYGGDTEGDYFFRLWVHGKVQPLSLRDYCEAQLNQGVLDMLSDRKEMAL